MGWIMGLDRKAESSTSFLLNWFGCFYVQMICIWKGINKSDCESFKTLPLIFHEELPLNSIDHQ